MTITATGTLGSGISAAGTFATHTISGSGGDTTPPIFSAGPTVANLASTSFDITATMDEWGTVYSLVQLAATGAPSIATIKATGLSAIDTGSGIIINHTGLIASTNYTAYVVAMDDDSNTQVLATDVDTTTPGSYDADAMTYFTAAGTAEGLKTAINTYFLNLKTGLTNATNVFSDIICLPLLINNDLAKDVVNAKNPGTFDGTMVNSPTPGLDGVTFDGSTQYMRMGVVPSTDTTLNDLTLSVYQVNNTATNSAVIGSNDGSNFIRLLPRRTNDLIRFEAYDTSGGRIQVANTNAHELVTATRRTSTDAEIYRNTASLVTSITGGGSRPAYELYLASQNGSGTPTLFIGNQIRLAMIGNGMTTAQIEDWSAANTQLMTDLGI